MQTRRTRESGQILILFTLAVVAVLAMLALLFDGGSALTLRRQLQDAGDSAALAAANTIQTLTPRTCSATDGPPPGAPQAAVVTAARNAVRQSLAWVTDAQITVSCPDSWSNFAVEVDLSVPSQTLFGRVVGISGIQVGTTSQAVNGVITSSLYSIIVLDPSHPSWQTLGQTTRRGCPSVLISGGPTITLEGSMALYSSCAAANGGALGTNGNAASITMNNSSVIRIIGDYVPSALTITPAPLTNQTTLSPKDPLGGLPAMPTLTTRSNSQLTISGGSQVLLPGVYIGGIQMKNTAKAYLMPGIYVMKGGGFQIGAQNAVYSLPSGSTTTTDATWATDCPKTTCGVLIYNVSGSGSTAMGQLAVTAGATVKLRPYQPAADLTGANVFEYQNLLIWQDANPVPTSSTQQQVVQLQGGGNVDISGTVYAPSALVAMGGGSGGSGGSTDITVQFICYDLSLQGNSSFAFRYRSDTFAKPTDYGLIK